MCQLKFVYTATLPGLHKFAVFFKSLTGTTKLTFIGHWGIIVLGGYVCIIFFNEMGQIAIRGYWKLSCHQSAKYAEKGIVFNL